jgi:L-threonylcarbamoyladenylate synthase
MPATPAGYAQQLYAALRVLDGSGAEQIFVEAPPESASWQAISDRLGRAALGSGLSDEAI